jgi:hypothetical protein
MLNNKHPASQRGRKFNAFKSHQQPGQTTAAERAQRFGSTSKSVIYDKVSILNISFFFAFLRCYYSRILVFSRDKRKKEILFSSFSMFFSPVNKNFQSKEKHFSSSTFLKVVNCFFYKEKRDGEQVYRKVLILFTNQFPIV